MAAVLSNGGGYYQPFAYVAEAMRMGLTVLPPDINASDFRCIGREHEIRIGLQFVKGLSADAVERIFAARGGQADGRSAGPFTSIFDLRARTGIAPSDLRLLIKVGAVDSIAQGWTRPMLLWMVDAGGQAGRRTGGQAQHTTESLSSEQTVRPADWFEELPPAVPVLKEYSLERRRREQYEILGFITDAHPMQLHAERLRQLRICHSTDLHRQVGRHVLVAGMLTAAKPVYAKTDEPMEFATFDDGFGLIEAVLFPDVYRERGHVLFDQGPFILRGKVEEEFGAVTLTITHMDRLERIRVRSPTCPARPFAEDERALLRKAHFPASNGSAECRPAPDRESVRAGLEGPEPFLGSVLFERQRQGHGGHRVRGDFHRAVALELPDRDPVEAQRELYPFGLEGIVVHVLKIEGHDDR
jgi:DNA polymerase III alpha subunit